LITHRFFARVPDFFGIKLRVFVHLIYYRKYI
jgi:hypothetical protein